MVDDLLVDIVSQSIQYVGSGFEGHCDAEVDCVAYHRHRNLDLIIVSDGNYSLLIEQVSIGKPVAVCTLFKVCKVVHAHS